MRLNKLLPDGRRQIVGFALPGDFLGMAVFRRGHGFSADAIGQVARSAGSPAFLLRALSRTSRISCAGSMNSRCAS